LSAKRWPDGVVKCPTCASEKVSFLENQKKWQCSARHPKRQFSIKVGTIMEDSPIRLDKWLPVLWLIANCRNGISSWEVSRAIGVTQKTAWFMLHRVRLAMQDDFSGGMLGGEIEVDETYIGGKARNMHRDRKKKLGMGTGYMVGKTVVLGILERETEKKPCRIRTSVIADRKKDSIAPEVAAHVEPGSQIHSDEHGGVWAMRDAYIHNIVNHAERYVVGNVHTNTLENFRSLLKRGVGGTYVSVEPFHLFRYIDEQAFRYNNRKDVDGNVIKDNERFDLLVSQILGRRLTYAQLTGKEEQRPEAV
ncbi:MAG: IS1595 family transposase, partial [Acidobacteriaceae bacterium]|nr:IS1595 family transposase [Acidobacteriaceae bacterium]